MATVKKRKLSGSTDGLGIKIAAIATAGTALHTAVAGTTPGTYDEVWLWAYNSHNTSILLTLEFGGVNVPDNTIVINVPAVIGLIPIVPGFLLQNGKGIAAFASVANKIVIYGFVNTITD